MMTILKSTTTKAHFDYQLKKPHWVALIVLAVAIAFASIHPLEVSSYILHQVGTVFGGVSKSMLALNESIIDIKEH